MCRLMDQQALQEQFKDLEYLAADFLEREDFESAAKCYQHLILDDPDDARAYSNTGYIKNVMFSSKRKEAKRVHDRLQGKATFGKMFGDWQNHSPEELATMANKFINDPEWVQVGFNPDKFSYFYNKATGNPLKSADEVIQIGALVLAKNVEELPIDDILNKTDVYTRNIDWIKDNLFDNNLLFNEGGLVNKLKQRNING